MTYVAHEGRWLMAENYADRDPTTFHIPTILDGISIAQGRRNEVKDDIYPTYHFFDDKGVEHLFPAGFVENFDWQFPDLGKK